MAQVSKIDPNQWYSLYIGTGTQNLVGTTLFQADRSVGTVYIAGEDTSKRNQRWQIFKLNSTAWILRSQAGGPNAYLGTFYAEPEVTEGKTVPRIVRGDIADASVFWTIGSWGDTTWYFSNLANGTGYRLMLKPTGGYLAMSPNITAPQVGQKWQFDTITAINDQRYSSVNLVNAVVATSSTMSASLASSATATTTPTTTANANNTPSSSGLSTGINAGIGAAVGLVALIVLVVISLFLWWKRKQRQPYSSPPQELSHDMSHNEAIPSTKYELHHDITTTYELPYTGVLEAPMNERPAELPGHGVHRREDE